MRVLPSTSQSSTWVVLPQGCAAEGDSTDCGDLRGILFDYNASTSFSRIGDKFWELPFQPEEALGYSGNSLVGKDTVVLGWDGSNGPTLENQIVTGFATKQPFLGIIGLTPRPVNVTDFEDQYPSPLGTLATNETVESYFGYTAGAKYRTPSAYGSLVLGGYDAARGNVDNVLTVPMGVSTSRDLVVAIHSIEISTGFEMEAAGGLPIYSFIDSTVPEIWLPISACKMFERAFDLIWNDTISMYMVNDTQHDQLVAKNATVSFGLTANSGDAATATTITLPYASFDLVAAYPLAGITGNETQRYFPLKQAQNDTQYYLGRTFLQEAYLAVDYDRAEFHLSQATFPSDVSASKIVAVGTNDSKPLSAGAIAGIVVGAVTLIALFLGLGWLYRKRRRSRGRGNKELPIEPSQKLDEDQSDSMPELDDTGNPLIGREELDSQIKTRLRAEVHGTADGELDGGAALHEAPAERKPVEVHGQTRVIELAAENEDQHLLNRAKTRSSPVELP